MRTRLTTLALIASVLLAGTVAFARQPGTASKQPSMSRSRTSMHGRTHRAKMHKATAARHIKIVVDGKLMKPSTPPLVRRGRVMVPMRSVFQDLGANVHWVASRREVTAVKGTRHLALRVGHRRAMVNGRMVRLDAAPIMHRNRVYVPLRTVSESLGGHVAYYRSRREVAITTTRRAVAAMPVMPARPRASSAPMAAPSESMAAPSGSMAMPAAHEAQGLPANAKPIQGATILINGKKLSTADEPVMVGNTVMVPAQVVLQDLNAKPTWNAQQRRLTAIHNGQRISVTAGNRNAMIGNRSERLSETPFVYRNQVYTPLDFIGRAVSGTATWEASRKEVVINTQARRAT